MNDHYAIIPASGIGQRFGGKKQFKTIGSKSILEITLKTFLASGFFQKIIVCLPKEDLNILNLSSDQILLVEGGQSRAESVYRGFSHFIPNDEDKVLIHDGVRPLVSIQLIENILKELDQFSVVIPGIDLVDTIKEIDQNIVTKTIDRSQLKAIQTPQGFKARVLKKIYQQLNFKDNHWTDEAMLAESLQEPVKIIPGERNNIKVTTLDDFKLAEFYLKELNYEI